MANIIRAIETVGLDELETTVFKATYLDDAVPKAKHVARLIELSKSRPNYDFLFWLDRRLGAGKWNVVLKVYMVIHRLAIEGHENILKHLQNYVQIFSIPSYLDNSPPAGPEHSRFCRAYAAYLGDKVTTYKTIQYSGERHLPSEGKVWGSGLDAKTICTALPLLQEQFDKLLACAPFGRSIHPIEAGALALLVKDAFRLHSLLTVIMLAVLDNFQKMDIDQAKTVLNCSKTFAEKQNAKFKDWAKELCRLQLVSEELLPNFEPIPSSFLSLLAEHVAELQKRDGKGEEKKDGGSQRGEKAPVSSKGSKKKTKTLKTATEGSSAGQSSTPTVQPIPVVQQQPVVEQKKPAFDPFDPINTSGASSQPQPKKPVLEFNIFDTPAPNKAPEPVQTAPIQNNTPFDPFAAVQPRAQPQAQPRPAFDPFAAVSNQPQVQPRTTPAYDPFFGTPAPANNDPFAAVSKPQTQPGRAYDPFSALSQPAAQPQPKRADPFAFSGTSAPSNNNNSAGSPFDILTTPAKPATTPSVNLLNASENPFFGGSGPAQPQPRRNSNAPTGTSAFDPFAGLTAKR